MKTFSLQGGVAGPPSACSSADNRVDVFAVGPGNMVWRWSWDGTRWTPPGPLPQVGVIPAEGVCAASSGPGRVEVFAAEAGSRSPVWWRGNNEQWSVGPPLQAVANLNPEPVAAVCSSPDSIDVFAAGAGNTPWWWHWNGSWWTAQGALPGGANLPAERIAAVSPAPRRLDVFAAGAGNHLWHWSRADISRPEVPWRLEDLGGNVPAEGVSAVSWGLNRIDVFAASQEAGNQLQHWWWTGNGFAGPETLGGNLTPGTVSAVSHAENRLDVFAVSHDAQLAHWQWDGQRWSGPAAYGDNIAAGDVSAVVRKPHRLDVFVMGADKMLHHWPDGGLENAIARPWLNWPTNHATNPIGLVWPDSLDELVNIVQEAGRLGREVRAVGSSWSNSDVAVTSGYVVETNRLNRVLADVLTTSLNARGAAMKLMHVEAGIKLYELNDILDKMGLALITMGGSSGQSLAGVLSTSAHGMDIDRGPIPDMVRAIHLVGPGGVQHWIEPSDGITKREALRDVLGLSDANIHYDDEWFNSALVSMGSLGVIYSLIVEVVPQYDLVSTREEVDWGVMKPRLKTGTPFLDANTRGVQVVINPYPRGDGSRPSYLTTRTRDVASHPLNPPNEDWLLSFVTPGLFFELRANRNMVDDRVSDLTRQRQKPGTERGWAHTIMGGPSPGPIRGLTVEIVFDATNTRYLDFIDAALEILYNAQYVENPPYAYLGWISLRFQGQSRAYLSPQHMSARTCTVEFAAAWRDTEANMGWGDTPPLLTRIEAEGRRWGGIQHWGLSNELNSDDVARAYPRLDTWRRLRWELTDGGTITTFDSHFTHRCGLSDPPSRPIAADYDRDKKSDFAAWRPSTGTWWIINSSTGTPRSLQAGEAGDLPVPGDYDGDGRTDFATWHPSTGMWTVMPASGKKQIKRQWGQPGDIPVPGDYDGDRKTDFAVWRPSGGMWFVIDSSTGKQRSQQWGQPGDVPVPGDYDSDGKTDFAVWRPNGGTWFVIDSSTGKQRSQQWGQPGDVPVPGDYDGDGTTDFAVWRPNGGMWFVIDSSTGKQHNQQWGLPSDIPVPGRYDGDGKTDFAIWRPSSGMWWIIDSSTGAQRSQQWGQFGDIPV